jgi:Ca2+:H+ antiporter
VVTLSRGTAVMMIIAYCSFLFFQLYTHKAWFAEIDDGNDEGDEEALLLNPTVALIVLLVSTILIGLSSEYLVGSLDGIAATWGVSDTFIGLRPHHLTMLGMIILPIVGNAAEHATAVSSAMRGKMELAIGVSLGSSLQISMFVTPLLVILGWAFGEPLTMNFPLIDVAVLFISIL